MKLEEAIEKLANESVECADIAENILEGKGKVAEDCREYVEALETVLNHLTKQDKMIELMLEYLNFYGVEDDICTAELSKDCNENCKDCIKQYFEKKAEEDSKCMK